MLDFRSHGAFVLLILKTLIWLHEYIIHLIRAIVLQRGTHSGQLDEPSEFTLNMHQAPGTSAAITTNCLTG